MLVGICVSAWQALLVAALHPDRVPGRRRGRAVARRTPRPPLPVRGRGRRALRRRAGRRTRAGPWTTGTSGATTGRTFAAFFFDQMLPRAALDQAAGGRRRLRRETTGETDAARGRTAPYPARPSRRPSRCCAAITAPVLVDPRHRRPLPAAGPGRDRGPAHRCRASSSSRVPATCRWRRDPVMVNRAIKALRRPGHRRRGAPPPLVAGPRRPPRVLYLSSPIGLGHVRRDLAIADALREQRPDLEVEWLTQSPVTEFLEQARRAGAPGVAPAGQRVAATSSRSRGEHDLHAFQAIRRMDEILVNNFMVFDDLVRERELRPVGRRRGLGPRPLPAREPRASSARRSPG